MKMRTSNSCNLIDSASARAARAASRRPRLPAGLAFSLIEIMVVVSLMTVIVLGLMAMFGQTQRAFRSSMTQVDVLANGRATMDMLTRELEQISASYLRNTTNFFVTPLRVAPLVQTLQPDTAVPETRKNVLEDFGFLMRENQRWTGTGYLVSPTNGGVGILFRYYTNAPLSDITKLSADLRKAPASSLNRIADGVVHLRLQAYDTNGYLIVSTAGTNNIFAASNTPPGEIRYDFTSNALPAYVELELGILEQRTLERLRSIPDAAAQRLFLERHAGQVHLFRQRIPVRNVDPTAYQ